MKGTSVKITFLGTGTSQGVPVIACNCDTCASSDPRDQRLRSAILVASATTRIVIDTGPDFRQQMLRANVQSLDAVVFTHEHKDHIAGLDDVRAFNFKQKADMPVYATTRVQEALKREFSYVFSEVKYPGIPQLHLHTISEKAPFTIGDIHIQPIQVMHHKLPVLGFRINDFTYITDANYISAAEKAKIKGSSQLVINALRHEPHISHFNVEEALAIMAELRPKQGYFTHISHLLGKHQEVSKQLPPSILLAYDGLTLTA